MSVTHLSAYRARRNTERLRDKLIENLSLTTIVTYERAQQKKKSPPTERQIRALRYIWMRGNLTVADLPALNWINLGGLVGRGLLTVPERGKLHVTAKGEKYLLS